MELVTLCQRKTMCYVFKVPKGLLTVLPQLNLFIAWVTCCLSTSPHGLLTAALHRCSYIFVCASEVFFLRFHILICEIGMIYEGDVFKVHI